ncbi:MAG TPA: hypothetical protein VMW54_11275 [Terriglobia bacterium]|nr:hypothetical protein [Terriglobia bacterium]
MPSRIALGKIRSVIFSFMIHLLHENFGPWPFVGFGVGLWFFYQGLRLFRKALVVADTPAIPIRSIAMGLSQVQGTAKGDGAFPSPVSGVLCYAFKVEIERWRRNSNRGGWSHYRTDVNGAHFCLEDSTGRVQVDPRGAELDLSVNCRRTIPDSYFSSWFDKDAAMPSADAYATRDAVMEVRSDDDLREYAEGIEAMDSDRFRFTEYCVIPGNRYDVLGTCTENPLPTGPDDRNLITKGRNEQTFLISSKAAAKLKSNMRWKSALLVWGGIALVTISAMNILAVLGRI